MRQFRKILNLIFTSVLFLILMTAICIQENSTYAKHHFDEDLTDGWMLVESDHSLSEMTFPYGFQDKTRNVQIIRSLPQVSDYHVLLMKCNYNSVTAYVDGEEIYHSFPSTFGLVETDLGHYVCLIPLRAEYSNKEITLNIEKRLSGYNSDIKFIRLTTVAQYSFQQLYDAAFRLFIALVLLVCAGIFFITWVVLCQWNGIIPEERYHPLLWISLFAASVGLWFFSEPHIWAIATGSFATSGIFNYLSLSLMPVSLLGILKSICTEKLPSLRWIVIIAKILLILEYAMFLTGCADFSDMVPILHLSCILAAGIFAFYLVWKQRFFLVGNVIRYGMWGVLAIVIITVSSYFSDHDWMGWALGGVIIILVSVLVSTIMNVTHAMKEIAQTKQYKEHALTDIMTGLKSRYAFTIFEAQQKVGNPSMDLCLIFLDINMLKKANDTLGHVAGDEMIIATSRCLRKAFGDIAECFRMGGDEFLVAITAAEDTVEERIELFNQLISVWKGTYVDSLSVSYGIVRASEYPGLNFEELFRTADARMYRHKNQRTLCN